MTSEMTKTTEKEEKCLELTPKMAKIKKKFQRSKKKFSTLLCNFRRNFDRLRRLQCLNCSTGGKCFPVGFCQAINTVCNRKMTHIVLNNIEKCNNFQFLSFSMKFLYNFRRISKVRPLKISKMKELVR